MMYSIMFQSGDWVVTVRAVNPLYTKTVVTNVKITEKVVGFEVSHDPTEVRTNEYTLRRC